MSGFIELCGAPGVGKSSLAGALAGRRLVTDRGRVVLIPARDVTARPRVLLRPLGPLLRSASVRGALASRPTLAHVTTRQSGAGGLAQAIDVPSQGSSDLLDGLVTPGPDDPRSDADYRTEALGWLESTLRTLRLAERLPADVVALLDEGVVQRTVSVLGTTASTTEQMRLLERLPRPAAVVHLVVEPERIVRRAEVRYREGRTPRLHAGRSAADAVGLALADADAIARVTTLVERLGVDVLTVHVGGEEDPQMLARRVVRGLHEIMTRSRD